MDIQFTSEQQCVINHQDGDLLVSAAAGSGKTAVLVERVLRMLTDPAHPVPLSRMLIVTFTNAAAEQMKEKIEKAILAKIEKGQGTPFLESQLREVASSHIQTNHAFSLYVLKQYITRIPGLDPGFRVADEAEAELIRINVLRDCLEYFYSEALKNEPSQDAKDFLTFIDCYGGRTQDRSIENLVLEIYHFMESEPDPLSWLSRSVDQTDPDRSFHFSSEDIYPLERFSRALSQLITCYEDVINQAPDGEKGKDKFISFVAELQRVQDHIMDRSDQEIYQYLTGFSWPKASYQVKWHPDGESLRKSLYEQVKKLSYQICSFGEFCFNSKVESLRHEFHFPAMRGLEALMRRLIEELRKEKNRRNLIEISDFEHYCLELLEDPLICRDLQNQFEYIYVDEYQDCSGIQEAILQKISRKDTNGHSCNLFLVGDVKQSIYRFRQADPGLFLEKYKTYGKIPSTERLLLSHNFRSFGNIIDSVNHVFRFLMTEQVGGLTYGEEEALRPGDPGMPMGEETSLFVLTAEKMSSDELAQLEAKFTAQQIQKEILSGRKPGDIVILMRSTTVGEYYLQELKKLGIACISDRSENFYDTREIQTIVNLLKIIDNPRQDIPLLGVLLSAIAGFTEEDLGILRMTNPEGDLYEAMLTYPEKGTNQLLLNKVEVFLHSLTEWRKNAKILGIRDLLWYLYRSTGIYLYFLSTERGRERSANLDLLIRKADAFENGTFHGLYAFLQYIEQLNKNRQEEAEAKIIETSTQTVRLLTIHKSKGLEFPVVYVAGLGRSFNLKDIKGSCQMHSRLGLGLPLADPRNLVQMDSIFNQMIRSEKKKEMMAEELRLLYVAMTRAMEKLVLIGSAKGDFSTASDTGEEDESDKTARILSADSFLSLLQYLIQKQGPGPIQVTVRNLDDEQEQDTQNILHISPSSESAPVETITEDLSEKFDYHYPYLVLGRTPQLISVSSVKEEALDEIEEVTGPSEAAEFEYSEGRMSPSERGTLFHTIAAMADPALLEEGQVLKAMEDLAKQGIIKRENINDIPLGWLSKWAGSDLFRRMRQSKEVYHEEPFVMSVPIHEIKTISSIAKDIPDTEEKEIMIQGIIDLFFREEDGFVLVDYKTDKVLDEGKIHGYGVQLSLYQRAIERATGVPVKEKKLFAVRKGEEIPC